jgi:cysteine-rich repeat protein
MRQTLRLSLLSISLGSCTLLLPLINADPCEESLAPSCDGNTLITCEAGFIREVQCEELLCNAATASCEGCGDGLQQADEACDDGNDTANDGCEFDCTVSLNCGDTIITTPEECDDGNLDDTDDCINCQIATCGDGFVQSGIEECDDNNTTNNDGCDSNCTIEVVCEPVGHDEDGDGIDDACDNCPTIANAGQANILEEQAGNVTDGVGDACDPRPAESGDTIAAFDAFAGNTLNPVWRNTNGWSVSGDKLVFTDLTASTIIRREDVDSINVVAEIFTTMVDHGSPFGNNGLVLGMPNPTDGLNCATEHNDGNGIHTLRMADVVNNNAPGLIDSAIIDDPFGDLHHIRMISTTDTLCEFNNNEATVGDGGSPAAGAIGIRSRTTSMTVNSFIVYRLGL